MDSTNIKIGRPKDALLNPTSPHYLKQPGPRLYMPVQSSLRSLMTVLVANYTPPAIRGMLKRWYVEPKPNVFVGTVNRRTRDKVLEYVKRNVQGMLPTRVGMVRPGGDSEIG
jgi:hypothetical protein